MAGYAEGLNLKFQQTMHPDVGHFLKRLGVQQTDGAKFLNESCPSKWTAGGCRVRNEHVAVGKYGGEPCCKNS